MRSRDTASQIDLCYTAERAVQPTHPLYTFTYTLTSSRAGVETYRLAGDYLKSALFSDIGQ